MDSLHLDRKKLLLKNFYKIAQQIAPPSGIHIEIGGAILRKVSISLTRFLQMIGYNQRQLRAHDDHPIIFNVGCGDMIAGDYITTDILPSGGEFLKLLIGKRKIKNELFLDITYIDKHLLNCADGIVISHVLEHIPASLVMQALECCFHYLKPGGCIRITVPFLGIYDQPNWPNAQEIGSSILAKNLLIYGWGHRFMYDVELLTLLMEEAGFCGVGEVQYKAGPLGEFDTPWRQDNSIYLIGSKPA